MVRIRGYGRDTGIRSGYGRDMGIRRGYWDMVRIRGYGRDTGIRSGYRDTIGICGYGGDTGIQWEYEDTAVIRSKYGLDTAGIKGDTKMRSGYSQNTVGIKKKTADPGILRIPVSPPYPRILIVSPYPGSAVSPLVEKAKHLHQYKNLERSLLDSLKETLRRRLNTIKH